MGSLNGFGHNSIAAPHLQWRLPIGGIPTFPYGQSLVGGTYACLVKPFELSYVTFGQVVTNGLARSLAMLGKI
ncbi:hypothetical protein H9L39_16997 [Fusarium oxysporum f. sp. albedinis]|nr:hypothetical protein H9L39_20037 [Fusarium oxysporum f. sp. albedinis]KAK2470766.1 hypothetical protein H9L39_16997 [Fusarium oxysporum f. sp. albedinis]